MAASAHTKGGYGGVPQSVGKDFNQADKGTKMLHEANEKRDTDVSGTVPSSKRKPSMRYKPVRVGHG